jgi:hypothetical protein
MKFDSLYELLKGFDDRFCGDGIMDFIHRPKSKILNNF